VVDTIDELSNLASKLNQQSDRLNSIISITNAKLEKLNIGLEVWVRGEAKGRKIDRHAKITMLGYAKVEDKWQLAFKQATFQTIIDGDQEFDEILSATDSRSLLKASRAIRIESMPLIPDLLTALESEVESALDDIDQAEKAAIKL
jgi:hypothetical protein